MNPRNNPFIRGFQHLTARRVLLIVQKLTRPPYVRELHPSQAHLTDDEVQLSQCVFGEEFALISTRQQIPKALKTRCSSKGTVLRSMYSLVADDSGIPIHVGDVYSYATAQYLIQRMSFEPNRYVRCWEVCSSHLPQTAISFLSTLANAAVMAEFVEPFTIPTSDAVGCKLLSTPWTDEVLMRADGLSAAQLRMKQRQAGMPGELVGVLHLAALADVRIIIFDPDASALDGLPVYPGGAG